MSETINWNASINVNNGPQLSNAGALAVDGYEKLAITIAKGKSATVTVGPGKWTGVSLLMIDPSIVDAKLTYKSGAITASLDGTHLLVGAGAVSLLGNGDAALAFNNGTAVDVSIAIVVGRSAS